MDDNSFNSISSSEVFSTTTINDATDWDNDLKTESMHRIANLSPIFKNYKEIKRFDHISGVESFSAVKLSNGEACNFYVIPYNEMDYSKLLKLRSIQCPYLLKHSSVEILKTSDKTKMILIEEPMMTPLLNIIDSINPDYGLLNDVPREDFEEDTIQQIISDVLQGAKSLHQAGFVHTCIRAHSVFCDPDGKILLGNLHMIQQSNELYFNEFLAHMPPEFVAKFPRFKTALDRDYSHEKTYDDFKSDSWSVGIFMYELVLLIDIDEYFDRIFRFSSKSLASKIAKRKIPSIEVLENSVNRQPKLSSAAKEFVNCCLIANPQKRLAIEHLLKHPFLKAS